MTDIVERLRNLGWPLCHEGADEIERLREEEHVEIELLHRQIESHKHEIERLRAAVRDAHGLIDNDLVIPWIIAHKLDDVLGIHKP